MYKVIFFNAEVLLRDKDQFIDGVNEVFKELDELNIKKVLLAKDRDLALHISDLLNFDYVFAPDLEVEGFEGFNIDDKLKIVREICGKEDVRLKEMVYVGKDEDEVEAMIAVNLGISFNSNNLKVDKEVDVRIRKNDLRFLLNKIK
jgi:phosphoserine phosphatase